MRLVGCLLAALLLVPAAGAWMAGPDRPHHADLAEEAAAALPPEARALLEREREAFRRGALDPDGIVDHTKGVHTFYHAWEPDDGGGGGVYRVKLSLHGATMALREGRPEEEVAYQMGFLTHFVTDLAMPFHTGDGLYDHPWHEPFEQAAYDHRHEYEVRPSRAPQEVDDEEAYAMEIARASAALAPRLVAALDASGGAWTPEAREVAREARQLAVDATADLLHTAFARADPARPAPVYNEDVPLPREPEDLGLSLREIQKHHPLALPMLAVTLLVGLVLLAAARRRLSG